MKFKTEKQILATAVAKAQEYELITTSDDIVERVNNGEQTENQYVLDLATHAYILAEFVQVAEQIFEGMDIATARGQQLDNMGKLVNVPRYPGLAAKLELDVTLTLPESEDIFIPAGTVVLIDPLQVDEYITYTTDEDVTIAAGVTTATIMASSDMKAIQRRVPEDCVLGLEGFPQLHVRNEYAGTNGRSIENDNEYRQRILLWNVQNQRGTKEAFDAYLNTVEGLDDYKLIPLVEGVGTMTVVCDCIESKIYEIEQGLRDNCMLITDRLVDCVNPDVTYMDISLDVTVTDDAIKYTLDELIKLIQAQTRIYLDGGYNINGDVVRGLRIGESFVPSQYVTYLHNLFPELISISCNTMDISIGEYDVLRARDVEVTIT